METFCKLSIGLLAYTLTIALVMVWASLSHVTVMDPAAGVWLHSPGHVPEMLAGGMIINQTNLANLFTGFKAQFQQAFQTYGAATQWQQFATRVPSSTRENHYAWLGQWPRLREWIGDRQLKGLQAHDYTVKNRKFEATIEVPRDDIEDDTYGVFAPLVAGMGQASAQHPDELIFELLAAGFTSLCYDGQNFFDTDHPVGDGVASNSGGGAGTPWYLLDTSKPLKPLLFQVRRDYELKAMTRQDDEVVFMRDSYRYGVDARVEAGFAFWQQAYGSKQTLDKTGYAAAREAMMSLKSDEGKPLGLMPNVLVVPPSLEGAGMEILNSERDAAGATNVWRNTAKLVVVPWLA